MTEALGWIATALFSASYFARRQRAMLAIQASAALLWIAYGVLAAAFPVVAANAIVAAAAAWSLFRQASRPPGALLEGSVGQGQ